MSINSSPDSGPRLNTSELGLTAALLGLPKTATTWMSHVLAEYPGVFVFDESMKIERLWLTGIGPSILVAESVTDPLCLRRTEQRLEALARLADRVQFSVGLLVLREPEEWVVSLYRQYVRRGGSRPFHEFIRASDGIMDAGFLDYGRLIDEVRSVSSGSFLVTDYGYLKRDPLAFMRLVLSVLGVAEDIRELEGAMARATKKGPVNYGIRGGGGRALRAINRLRRTGRWNPDGLISWRGVEKLPWHRIARFGKDLVTEEDLLLFRKTCLQKADWEEWESCFQAKPVIEYG